MVEITVHVEADVNPTESEEKVKAAVANMFGELSLQVKPEGVGSLLTGEARSQRVLENFRQALRRDQVRSATRKLLRTTARGNCISFCLNKQVAYAGHVSFSEETGECPLGPIRIVIETDYPRELIDWLAPKIT